MPTIRDMLDNAQMKSDILMIAFNLEEDDLYTKQDAIQDLLKLIEKFDL